MTIEAIDDIEKWSKRLSIWRQDALRRLVINNELTNADVDELLAMIKNVSGFSLDLSPPTPIPFTKSLFVAGKVSPITILGIADVENVNKLVPKATLRFCPKSLTVVYGRNGSGKSGFVRILRNACRTRVENSTKLRVLSDVYAGSAGPQKANILIDVGSGEVPVTWSPGMPSSPQLMQVSVFDTLSAQFYVDGGSQIRYLPFGLALPYRLNTVCLKLKNILENEQRNIIGDKISLTTIVFPVARLTAAQSFNQSLCKDTTDSEIDEATAFSDEDQKRHDELVAILSAGAAVVADLKTLIGWVESIINECKTVTTSLSDTALSTLTTLKNAAVTAREAAQLAADKLFTDEPLPGVGSESWRALWSAARDYSLNEAYPETDFPVTWIGDEPAVCVLCQQPLHPDGTARMQRFQKYMDDTLDTAATKAAQALTAAVNDIPELPLLYASDFANRIEQIRHRNTKLADSLEMFQTSVLQRKADAQARLAGEKSSSVLPLETLHDEMNEFLQKLKFEKEARVKAGNTLERENLTKEKAQIEDRKVLFANRVKLVTRRDLLRLDACYEKALAEVQTRGITQYANQLVDTHLTSAVVKHFNTERELFDIEHLNVGLSRKSDRTKAEFQVDPHTKLTKLTSDILSEGEQRVLALAGFLTEVALTEGAGPIIVDDPVSSLDRSRGSRVAKRLAEESCNRQVIIFTHDIIFFNEVCGAAENLGIEPVTISLFSDKDASGKIDPSGMVWKGLNVSKRIGRIRNDLTPLAKLLKTSPSDYEYRIKNLYGRLRDTYERVVEEVIFNEVVRRGTDVIQTQRLRCVALSDAMAIRFHDGMTKANTHSHDNPAADTVPVPTPEEFEADIVALETLVGDIKIESAAAEKARPQMKPKK